MPAARRIPPARLVLAPDDRREVLSMIEQSLVSGSLTLGSHTVDFEQEFAKAHQSPYAVAVSSGTAALEIICRSLNLEGAEVVVPTNTFFASAAAVMHAGGRVRLADIDPATMCLSAASVEAALTDATTAVMVVHIGGLISPEIERIAELCRRRRLTLIEDAAHAQGSSYKGRPAGSFGRAAAFSFYPTKVITSGEGGMIVTADPTLAEEALVYRDQGKAGFHGGDHVRMGYAWRMSELHAALGLVQLRRLEQFIGVRRHVARRYDDALPDISGISSLSASPDGRSNVYKYIALLDPSIDRAKAKTAMASEGVSLSGEVYGLPLHLQPVFAGMADQSYPVAEDLCRRHICLPVYSDMTDDEIDQVLAASRTVLPPLVDQ